MAENKTYQLPKIPPSVIPTFESLCESVPVAALPDLKKQVDVALAKLCSSEEEPARPP